MSNNNNNTQGGIGLGMIIFLIFMTLKLTGDITWSWWYVTLPLWGPLLVVIVILAVVGILHIMKKYE
jgi:hypothetical protein